MVTHGYTFREFTPDNSMIIIVELLRAAGGIVGQSFTTNSQNNVRIEINR